MKKTFALAVVIAASTLAPASALTWNGAFWKTDSSAITLDAAATAAAVIGGPHLEFKSDVLSFGKPSASPVFAIGTVDEFLTSNGATISSKVDTDLADGIDFDSSMGFSYWEFTASVKLNFGESYFVESDDGFEVTVDVDGDGTYETSLKKVDGLRPPFSSTSFDSGGLTGVYDVKLSYFEGATTQAQLESDLTAVPLPAGVWLLGTALAGLGMARRKRKTA